MAWLQMKTQHNVQHVQVGAHRKLLERQTLRSDCPKAWTELPTAASPVSPGLRRPGISRALCQGSVAHVNVGL